MQESELYVIADKFFFNDYEEKSMADEQTMLNHSYFIKGLRKAFEIKSASPPSMPDEVIRYMMHWGGEQEEENINGDWVKYEDYERMRSQCDGLIKQKAVEFAEWVVEVTDTGGKYEDFNTDLFTKLTTEELYEIFNQQER